MFADEHVQQLQPAAAVASPYYDPLRLVTQAVKLSRTPSELRTNPPESGEHTAEILGTLGYSLEQIADFRARGIA
jgi:crotonobetainyl-CoA:carnitine CoA-transferase CaiB-like acyl-CoA transferase